MPTALDGLRVIEVGVTPATAYAAKLFADHGADVVTLEPPEGSPVRRRGDALHIALNVNKQSAVLTEPDLSRYLAWADVLIHGLQPRAATAYGVDAPTLTDRYPALVTLAITPFGQTGPYADYAANELILANGGGWANVCPATHSEPERPPLKVAGEQCHYIAAISGATTALAAWRHQQQTGCGEYIDFAIQAYVASVLEAGIPAFTYKGDVVNRTYPRSLIPWRIFHAKDAPVFIVCIEQDQWERLVTFMGNPDWADVALFETHEGRAENQDLIHSLVQEFVSEWHAMELFHAAQAHRVCVAPVMDLAQIDSDPHLQARGLFTELHQPGVGTLKLFDSPILTDSGRVGVRYPAPALGAHTAPFAPATHGHQRPVDQPTLPLDGVRVVDMTWAWAGPFCSLNLAHLGAEVIRVESATRTDLYRRLPLFDPELEPGLNRSGMFNQWNQGKRSFAVDLAHPEGIQAVRELIKVSDIVVQNYATGVMDRLGLDYQALKALNPKIILASVSGYGQSGPYRNYMGYGPAIPPLTGLSMATGYHGEGPDEIGLSMPDPTAGITAAWGILNALHERDRTGAGAHLDVTLWESTGVLNMEAWTHFVLAGEQPMRQGNRSEHAAPHGVFPCRGDDQWIAIACNSDAEWQQLAAEIDNDTHANLSTEPRFKQFNARKTNEDALEDLVAQWTASQDKWALTQRLQNLGISAFPTLDIAEVVNDKHLNARHFIERLPHPEVGARAHTGIPWQFHHRPNGVRCAAPCLGEGTEAVLMDILGYTSARVAQLREQGVVWCVGDYEA